MAGEGAARTIVVKVGSSTVVGSDGRPDRAFIESLCDQAAELVSRGMRVVIVSSGAAAAGMGRLGFSKRPTDLATLQACCSAGQASLTETYAELLGEHGIPCGQVLLTRGEVVERESYLNARGTLSTLLDLGAVPVVNENDALSSSELSFGDNDTLGAIVATLVDADLYVIMSDIDGLYTANPADDPTARLIPRVDHIDAQIMSMAGGAGSAVGTGGMVTKLRAARAMLAAGIPMAIVRGRREHVLADVAMGEPVGTIFSRPEDDPSHESPRKLWIGLAGVPRGTVTVDQGARRALVDEGGSLLPVGIIATTGVYAAGDVVSVADESGQLLGRGIARYSSDQLRKAHGVRLDVIARFMPELAGQPFIHRDELLLF